MFQQESKGNTSMNTHACMNTHAVSYDAETCLAAIKLSLPIIPFSFATYPYMLM